MIYSVISFIFLFTGLQVQYPSKFSEQHGQTQNILKQYLYLLTGDYIMAKYVRDSLETVFVG